MTTPTDATGTAVDDIVPKVNALFMDEIYALHRMNVVDQESQIAEEMAQSFYQYQQQQQGFGGLGSPGIFAPDPRGTIPLSAYQHQGYGQGTHHQLIDLLANMTPPATNVDEAYFVLATTSMLMELNKNQRLRIRNQERQMVQGRVGAVDLENRMFQQRLDAIDLEAQIPGWREACCLGEMNAHERYDYIEYASKMAQERSTSLDRESQLSQERNGVLQELMASLKEKLDSRIAPAA